ncbi:hypothetical protein HF086_006351, partial [Spodoptera exigua]
MAAKSKTLLLLIVTNFIIAQAQLTSEEIKTAKGSEELTEEATAVIEEDDLKTTTELSVTQEDVKDKEDEQQSAEIVTEEVSVDVTAASSSNVVDDVGNIASNLSNNIETVAKVNDSERDDGVNWRSRHNLQPSSSSNEKTVAEALSKLLLKYQGVNTETTNDGTMRALATAAKLVPYDSALFVITDKGPGDPQRLPLALRALVEKRLKVLRSIALPNPAHPSPESEEALQELRNVSKHTEGEVMPYPLQVMDMEGTSNLAAETELEQWSPLDPKQGRRGRLHNDLGLEKLDLLLVRRGAEQAISLGVPVENGVTALRVFIEGAVDHAVLYPPNDAPQIDLYNTTSVAAFSSTSRTEGVSPRDVYLVFPGTKLSVLPMSPDRPEDQAAYVGMWHLSI